MSINLPSSVFSSVGDFIVAPISSLAMELFKFFVFSQFNLLRVYMFRNLVISSRLSSLFSFFLIQNFKVCPADPLHSVGDLWLLIPYRLQFCQFWSSFFFVSWVRGLSVLCLKVSVYCSLGAPFPMSSPGYQLSPSAHLCCIPQILVNCAFLFT